MRVISFPRTAASAPRWRPASGRPPPRSSPSSTPTARSSATRCRVIVAASRTPKVGAIAGHAEVQNARESWITRMQAVRYFVAFSVLQGGRVDLRRGHVLLGLLLRLPARGDRPRPGRLGAPALPRRAGHLRRRPLADQLRAARLEGPLRANALCAHDRAGELPRVPAPAAALEALLDARVADRRPLHLAQEPDRGGLGLPRRSSCRCWRRSSRCGR